MKTKSILLLMITLLVPVLTGCKQPGGSDSGTTYTVTFHAGSGGTGKVAAIKAKEGSVITLPSGDNLSRSGYTFVCWNTRIEGNGKNWSPGDSYTVNDNVTLYAKWERGGVTYTITFSLNYQASEPPPDPMTVTPGRDVTLPSASRAGYTLGSWNTMANGTGDSHNAGSSSYRANDGNITLYAQWVFTVTFNNNGGGVAPSPRNVVPGSSVVLPSSSREGLTFTGWNTNNLGTGTAHAAGSSFTPTANITLYAQWLNVYTIVFDANGNEGAVNGTVPIPMQATNGESITIPGSSSFSIAYTTFTGWNTTRNGTGTAVAAGSSYTPPGSITLYAQWSAPSPYASVTDNLEDKLTWIQAHAENNGNYNIQVSADETIYPKVFSGSNVKVTLTGSGSNRNVRLLSHDSMFKLNTGVTLTLDNIMLRGIQRIPPAIAAALVSVNGGTLIMNGSSGIFGDTTDLRFPGEGGVYVGSGGTFTMNSGTISGNGADGNGGGVHVANGATFTMAGGTIEYNYCFGNGGGVYVAGLNINGLVPGNFTKTGGTIQWNLVRSRTLDILTPNHGHAVYVYNGNNTLRRETTAGPTDNLSYVNGVSSGGWMQ